MTRPPIQNRRDRPHPAQPVMGEIALTLARVHEACGLARRSFAMMVAGRMAGPVFWISPRWDPDRLNPEGMQPLAGPERFRFLTPRRPEDILWTMEEALRSGAVPLVVAELPGLPGLTPVRRLHLAAETGAAEGAHAPLGLLLTPGEGGAQGVESRWHMAPAHGPRSTAWHLGRLRARTAPVKHWRILPDPETGVRAEPVAATEEDAPQPREPARDAQGGQTHHDRIDPRTGHHAKMTGGTGTVP